MRTSAQIHGLRRLTTLLLLVAVIVYLNGCGGGGSAPAAPNKTQQAADLATAQKVYAGTPRTPAGFYADPAPVGVTGTVATLHLKNSDLAGAPVNAAAFEQIGRASCRERVCLAV